MISPSISIDFRESPMLEVITSKRSYAYAQRSQIWPEYKLNTASCLYIYFDLTGHFFVMSSVVFFTCLFDLF